MLKDFMEFLKEYKIVSLAVAFVMGSASTALVNSLVKDIIMPILSPLLSAGAWNEAMLDLGPVHLAYGAFLAAVVNFLIMAFVVYIVVKKLFREEQKEQAIDKAVS